ncbi:MAG TPA: Mrp/NBP35 family ATP-binding protein [Candidatus Krumholzibacteria bacterium]|jgi:ATP-binding protein involved in chromosome partitioning|nr:Mrp/NBP35 family ATP-binding protein [Candidatus Krumholzibacteria bacterium]
MLNESSIQQALEAVADVYGVGSIVSQRRIEKITIRDGVVMLSLNLPVDDAQVKQRIESDSREEIKKISGVREVIIMTKGAKPSLAARGPAAPNTGPGPVRGGRGADPFEGQAPIEGVRSIIAVSSAKGGVGKSTICVNLALALAAEGARVGLMDADVYGPSIHVLMGTGDARPQAGVKKEIAPVEKDGLKLMSLGFLTERGQPVIWRGPIVMGVVKKFLTDVDWGELDYLMIDMPPGTGDAQLTLVQTVPLTGAIIVTTPSELSLVDAEKGLEMYRSVHAPVLGIIENMTYFVCPHCGERTDIFSHGGGREISQRLGVDFLGELPLDPTLRKVGDEGRPIVLSEPNSPVARAFFDIAGKIRSAVPQS